MPRKRIKRLSFSWRYLHGVSWLCSWRTRSQPVGRHLPFSAPRTDINYVTREQTLGLPGPKGLSRLWKGPFMAMSTGDSRLPASFHGGHRVPISSFTKGFICYLQRAKFRKKAYVLAPAGWLTSKMCSVLLNPCQHGCPASSTSKWGTQVPDTADTEGMPLQQARRPL